ncbi:MAG: hypothetical protein K6G10_11785 [Butyrivibrio sp.]|nr:hypothetical protein [Butyrivibrio sp.]
MENTIRVHRVGSLTAGISLIVFGIAFILHLFANLVSYEMIFRLWPFIIIGMGVELLVSNMKTEKIVYDKGSIVLLILMAFFAMTMAGADWVMLNLADRL